MYNILEGSCINDLYALIHHNSLHRKNVKILVAHQHDSISEQKIILVEVKLFDILNQIIYYANKGGGEANV